MVNCIIQDSKDSKFQGFQESQRLESEILKFEILEIWNNLFLMEKIWQILEEVCDPEVPVLSVLDLGIIRHVEQVEGKIIITITPTYSGCPAMNTIEKDIKTALLQAGFDNIEIKTILSPAWTTDWLSENGKRKLEAYGIAPPVEPTSSVGILFGKDPSVSCPQCHSKNTIMVSQFGSTACKALYKCQDCLEPFDYFKCLR